ncbi:MAG: NADH-quinone oxidoreductase subunit NuoF, partial [Candidatus Subteraquimicrobiales bacterium]|nr:NADH-quinone oxidoreductase subunit NuoF [Candidatus Subteraquimicrobiales bacterium]
MSEKKVSEKKRVLICTGTGCVLSGSLEVSKAFESELKKAKLEGQVSLTLSGCHGFCSQGPIVVVYPEGIFYPLVKPKQVPRIVQEHLKEGRVIEDFLFTDPITQKKIPEYRNISFYKKQTRLVLRNCGVIDPENIDEYVNKGGYRALKQVLSISPEEVIEEVKKSGLRGRGGAGFPTGLKWEFTRKAPGDEKYLICNADEGDPGAFMDRSILEGDPHVVIEGMAIAAYAIGVSQGYIYVRAEYPLAVKRFKIALSQAEKEGFLGKNIWGTPFSFNIKVKEGAGAFVCGEETALIASIEGKRGMPRLRPPYPAVSGLWGKPTCINNVETLANIAWIILNGADKFNSIGTEKSKGTKIFAVTGKVKNSGLVEVPMGITLREVIFDICGGIKDKGEFKAVQIGGPSGGCLPEEFLDTTIDYESLNATGAIMGSGGMVVMDKSICMVDLAKFFINFTQNESCGKCVPCRLGTRRMLEMLKRLTKGQAYNDDLSLLETLARDVKAASLCGLGQTAPNPVLTTLKYFLDEYEAHVKERRCAAGVCKDLVTYAIKENLCKGCGICAKHCPVGAISGAKKEPYRIDESKCVRCGL